MCRGCRKVVQDRLAGSASIGRTTCQPSGPVQACNGTALPFFYSLQCRRLKHILQYSSLLRCSAYVRKGYKTLLSATSWKLKHARKATCVQRNTQARSCNHFAIESIKYYIFWVCVCRLNYPAYAILSSVTCPVAQYFYKLFHKRCDFRKESYWTQKACFDFFCNICLKHFSF